MGVKKKIVIYNNQKNCGYATLWQSLDRKQRLAVEDLENTEIVPVVRGHFEKKTQAAQAHAESRRVMSF